MTDFWDSIDIGNEIVDLMGIKEKMGAAVERTVIRTEKYKRKAAEYLEAYQFANDGNNEEYLKWHHIYKTEHKNSIELLERLRERYRSLEMRIGKLTS